MRFPPFFMLCVGTLLLFSCSTITSPEAVQPTEAKQYTKIPSLHPSNSPTRSVTSTTTPSFTAVVSGCNVSVDDCFLVNTFFLSRPISPQENDDIDTHYRFGSTMDGKLPAHHGVEFENSSGTPVLASYDGVIVFAGNDEIVQLSPWQNFYGNVVIIEHTTPRTDTPKLYTLYGHLSKVGVTQGQRVIRGEQIGEVGLSGSALGSHLHFEIRLDPFEYNSALNPELFLTPHVSENEIHGGIALRIVSLMTGIIDVSINIQYYPDHVSSPANVYLIHTYEDADLQQHLFVNENAAIGDLQPGNYRVTLIMNGKLYEKWVRVESGTLTYTTIETP